MKPEFMAFGSKEFEEWRKEADENYIKNNSPCVCQQCWRYVKQQSRKVHEEQGHKLLKPKCYVDNTNFNQVSHLCGRRWEIDGIIWYQKINPVEGAGKTKTRAPNANKTSDALNGHSPKALIESTSQPT